MNHRNLPSLPLLLAAATVTVACLGAAGTSAAAETARDLDDATLAKAFWDCDIGASQEAASAGEGALCVMLTEALKERHFGGDFLRMLAWWREQRHAEYARRGTALPAAAADAAAALQAP